jgi:23S rRNA-/tRNA-specific pseudouridylate synthase
MLDKITEKRRERDVDWLMFYKWHHKDRWSLVKAVPRTGRWHQIRRHAKHLSHPIVGDVRYGEGEINRVGCVPRRLARRPAS